MIRKLVVCLLPTVLLQLRAFLDHQGYSDRLACFGRDRALLSESPPTRSSRTLPAG